MTPIFQDNFKKIDFKNFGSKFGAGKAVLSPLIKVEYDP